MSREVTTGSFSRAISGQTVNKWVGMGYDRFPALWKEIASVENMDRAFEEDMHVSNLGLFRQSVEGETSPYDGMKQTYATSYRAVSYRLGIIVTREMIEDGKGFPILEQRAKQLGVAASETHNIIVHNLLNRATNASYVGGDDVALLSTAHPTVSGVNNANMPAVATTFSEAALEQAYIDMGNYVDDRGLKMKAYARKLILPRALTFEAKRILGSDLQAYTAENQINAVKNLNIFPEGVLISDYITTATNWFIQTTVDPSNGLKVMVRKPLAMDNDVHFDTDNVKMKGYFRLATGWSEPLSIHGSVGA